LTQEDRPTRLTPQLLLGLMVIGIGVLFTLDNLGIAHWSQYVFRYWPAGLIAIGILKLWQSHEGGGAFGGLLFTLAGTWLLLEQTALVRIRFVDLWPLLLVFVGAFLVWQGVSGPRRRASDDSNATVSAMAVLGGVSRGNNARAFKGGDLTAIMGGCELDLRHAGLEGPAVIDVFAIWGGIEIRVPEDWTVVSRVTPFLAGFTDNTRPTQTAANKQLVIRGFILMAGVDVKN
jgi:cell wall-active antibiotic response 4TMS protein YvqF